MDNQMLLKYKEVIIEIIKEQSLIVGPIALELAKNVETLKIEEEVDHTILTVEHVDLDPEGFNQIIDSLINEYKKLFGKTSELVCIEVLNRKGLNITSNNKYLLKDQIV
jgi:hypothetical protein